MSLRNTQKPLRDLLTSYETAALIVAVPSGTQPRSVITATYDVGLAQPFVSNKAGNIGALSPIDGVSQQPTESEQPSAVELLTREFLVRVGECANCSCDLYADNALADAMQEIAHLGACVMCGSPVSFTNSGELARIATSVERDGQTSEVANYFDFSELQTVDPNTVEENDMSNKQARAALRASVASVMQSILTNDETASDDDTVGVVPSEDEEDFASENEDDEALDTMDMDESDPAEDDESEDGDDEEVTNDEEAADTNASAEDTSGGDTNEEEASDMSGAQTDPAPEAAPIVDSAPATDTIEQAPIADETAGEETLTNDASADLVEAAPAADVVVASDDTVIEYVATIPANLSIDAELVPVSETAFYVVQDDAPVAVLRKENASAGAQSLWHKPVELRNAYVASLSGDREVALASFGGKILTHSTNVAGVVAERIARSESAAAVEIAAERSNVTSKLNQCLEIAAVGVIKGMFGAKRINPIAAELAGVLEVNGVRDPRAIVTASMLQSSPKFIATILEVANELMAESEDALSAKAELVGNSDFIAPIAAAPAPVEAPPAAAPAPVLETANVKKKVDVQALTRNLGRSLHG